MIVADKRGKKYRWNIEPVGEIGKMSEESPDQSVGGNLDRSYPDLGGSAGKRSADLKDQSID